MVEKQNLIITAALVIVIITAIGILIYVNLPTDETIDNQVDDNNTMGNATFQFIYNQEKVNYSLAELEKMPLYEGIGSKIKTGFLPEVRIDGPHNYTGVRISTLINDINLNNTNYSVCITSSDGEQTNLTYNEIQGKIPIYNDTGEIVRNDNVTLMIAIREDGEYLTEDDGGPLRIVIVGDKAITSSSYWIKSIISLEFIE